MGFSNWVLTWDRLAVGAAAYIFALYFVPIITISLTGAAMVGIYLVGRKR